MYSLLLLLLWTHRVNNCGHVTYEPLVLQPQRQVWALQKALPPICSNHLILLQVPVGLLRHPKFLHFRHPLKFISELLLLLKSPDVQLKLTTALHQLRLRESFLLPVSAAFLLPPCCLLITPPPPPNLHARLKPAAAVGQWLSHLFLSQMDSFALPVIFLALWGDRLPCLV